MWSQKQDDCGLKHLVLWVATSTVKFVCESALCLAVDFDRLPGGAQQGEILTPATGLENVLLERLRKAGMRIEAEVI